MSLVGPRPLLVEYLPHYKLSERRRHSVRPGITGASQVSGRNNLGWDERLALDAEYAQNGTLLDDFKIIAQTILGVLRREDAIAEPWNHGEYLSTYRSYPNDGTYALRRFEPQDVPDRVRWLNDPRTRETLSLKGEITVDTTYSWLEKARKNPLRKDLAVYEMRTSRLVAIAGYKAESVDEIPIFYFAVDPDLQGRRIGSATLKLLLEYMESQSGVHGAAGEIYRHNERSIKIHQRLGFEVVAGNLPEDRLRMEIRW
jgi:RimJ/RimL family protein N-acetyltransferase